jgi:hypothetical protein
MRLRRACSSCDHDKEFPQYNGNTSICTARVICITSHKAWSACSLEQSPRWTLPRPWARLGAVRPPEDADRCASAMQIPAPHRLQILLLRDDHFRAAVANLAAGPDVFPTPTFTACAIS